MLCSRAQAANGFAFISGRLVAHFLLVGDELKNQALKTNRAKCERRVAPEKSCWSGCQLASGLFPEDHFPEPSQPCVPAHEMRSVKS